MEQVEKHVPGYTYGTTEVPPSPVSLEELENLKVTVGFKDEDRRYLQMAGEVLRDQTRAVVLHWRSGIIAAIPHLARHSRSVDGTPIPDYLARSNLRFEQWILDTCLRPYDQDWLNYQHEIALRHTSLKKNQTDGAHSTPYVPLRDVLAFIALMNETIRPYLAAMGHSLADVDAMHRAWCKSMHLQSALLARPYTDPKNGLNEW